MAAVALQAVVLPAPDERQRCIAAVYVQELRKYGVSEADILARFIPSLEGVNVVVLRRVAADIPDGVMHATLRQFRDGSGFVGKLLLTLDLVDAYGRQWRLL